MNKSKLVNLLERASWTFVQAFLASWVLSNQPFTKLALIGALGFGLSALKTFILDNVITK